MWFFFFLNVFIIKHKKDMKKVVRIKESELVNLIDKIITETTRKRKITEGVTIPTKDVSGWSLKDKLEDVHGKVGQGSIFAKSIDDVLNIVQDTLNKRNDIDKIANTTGTVNIKVPNIGYNLVLPIEDAKKLPNAQETEVEKIEGPNKIKVPAIKTTAPINQFRTDELTIIVRPKKDEKGTAIPNEYIVLSAFPGDPNIPRTSEWGGRYAVIIPDSKEINENKKVVRIKESDLVNLIDKIITESNKTIRQMINEEEYYHRGQDGTQSVIIPDNLGEVNSEDFAYALESYGQGSMDERDFQVGVEYTIIVTSQSGDEPTKEVTFKLKKSNGDKLEVDKDSISTDIL